MIHPTAIVDVKAELGNDVHIGPYSIIGENVSIGSGTIIGPHVVIEPFVEIQDDCQIHPFAAIGGIPQSVRFKGEESHIRIGRGTIIREFVTIHRGTEFGGGLTQVGEASYIMAYCHIAHDCIVGKHTTFANGATLAGHITIGDYAYLAGYVAIHQFVRVGDHAFIGGHSAIVKDIPPFVMAEGNRARLFGLNTVGLKRHGFSDKTLSELKKTYRIVFRSGIPLTRAVEKVRAEVGPIPEVLLFLDFIQSSERGITR
jgi:UDP-N-acetylglucosamine acyltransferase